MYISVMFLSYMAAAFTYMEIGMVLLTVVVMGFYTVEFLRNSVRRSAHHAEWS